MNSFKLSLIGIAVVAAMALVGAGTASAGTVFECLLNKLPCPESEQVPVGGMSKGFSEGATLQSALSEKCPKSAVEIETGEPSGEVRLEKIVGLSFSGSCEPCTAIEAVNLPYKATLSALGKGNGMITTPLELTLSGCPFETTCTFGASGVELERVGSTTESLIVASKEKLLFKAGTKLICGSSAELSATYATEPSMEWVLSE